MSISPPPHPSIGDVWVDSFTAERFVFTGEPTRAPDEALNGWVLWAPKRYLISWLDHDRTALAVSEYYGDRERAISWACETMRAGRLEETINAYGFVVTLKPPDTNDGKLSNA